MTKQERQTIAKISLHNRSNFVGKQLAKILVYSATNVKNNYRSLKKELEKKRKMLMDFGDKLDKKYNVTGRLPSDDVIDDYEKEEDEYEKKIGYWKLIKKVDDAAWELMNWAREMVQKVPAYQKHKKDVEWLYDKAKKNVNVKDKLIDLSLRLKES